MSIEKYVQKWLPRISNFPASTNVNWHNFLTGDDDATINNVSFLSSPAEWHALGIGAILAIGGPLAKLVIPGYVAGRATHRLNKSLQTREGVAQHIKDAMDEPVYVGIGYAATTIVITVASLVS